MAAAKGQVRPRRLPQRTCVSCGSTTAKRELIRLVRTPTGAVEPDPTGKAPGRGAYLCHRLECWESALRKGRLEGSLRVKIPQEARESLLRFGRERLGVETA